MSVGDPLLDRKAIERAFRLLADRLARRGLVADIYVFAGAAMALAYDARRATRDTDAVSDAEVRNVGSRTVGDGEMSRLLVAERSDNASRISEAANRGALTQQRPFC